MKKTVPLKACRVYVGVMSEQLLLPGPGTAYGPY